MQGRDALPFLQRLCAAEMDVPTGKMVYTPLLNERGGYESDLTVMRLASDRFMIVTGSAQATRDRDWLQRHGHEHEWVNLSDVTAQTCVLSLMGPRSAELMQRVSPDDVSAQALGFAMTREIDLGFARVRVARMSYVGGPGYELYVPVEMTRHVYQVLQEAGIDLGLRNAGYYALDALRIERLRRAWGAELGPDETPIEAGMLRGIAKDKPGSFIGQEALRLRIGTQEAKKLVRLRCLDKQAYLWGGEPLMAQGYTIGEITSAGWGWEAGTCVARPTCGASGPRGPWGNCMPTPISGVRRYRL